MQSSLPFVIGAIVVLAWCVLASTAIAARRRKQWRARWEDFIRRCAELYRELDRIWECG
jgi:hypothetical protein